MMSNRNLLVLLVFVALGILAVVVFRPSEVNNDGPLEKIGNSVSEVTEEINDEIDDNTTDVR